MSVDAPLSSNADLPSNVPRKSLSTTRVQHYLRRHSICYRCYWNGGVYARILGFEPCSEEE